MPDKVYWSVVWYLAGLLVLPLALVAMVLVMLCNPGLVCKIGTYALRTSLGVFPKEVQDER